jgi:hypothetical protein
MKALIPPLAVQWDFPEKKPQKWVQTGKQLRQKNPKHRYVATQNHKTHTQGNGYL